MTRRATWLAFRAVVHRSLSTSSVKYSPKQACSLSIAGATGINAKFTAQSRRPIFHTRHVSDSPDGRAIEVEATTRRESSGKSKASRTSSDVTSASLRRVAVEAQRSSRELIKGTGKRSHVDPEVPTKDVTAYCVAERYDLIAARKLLETEGYASDPLETGLFPQVIHAQIPNNLEKDVHAGLGEAQGGGDIFLFPSGCLVAWNVPDRVINSLLHRILPHAAENGHLKRLEAEDLQYLEDPNRDVSRIVGDTIVLGCKAERRGDLSASAEQASGQARGENSQSQEVDTVLAKIAFSSALARSAKLAVLEKSLERYFESTRTIPTTLSSGRKLRLTRAFMLRKTGELLSIRAQLNLYSELTDSLPDIFWDSPFELGLENYYDMVGRALDVHVRIKTLNDRMDYAGEIAQVLRERLSEKHSTGLEWLIIGLISIEVAFGILHLWRERSERLNPDSTKALLTQWLEREMRKETSE